MYAPVAQLDRAPDYESGGQEFESLRVRHYVSFRFSSVIFGIVNSASLIGLLSIIVLPDCTVPAFPDWESELLSV